MSGAVAVTKSKPEYRLNFVNVLRYLRTALDSGSPLSIVAVAQAYRHEPEADLSRVRAIEGTDDPTQWLIRKAADTLSKWIEVDGDTLRLKDRFTPDDLRFQGKPIAAEIPRERSAYVLAHEKFNDPFNPLTGRYAENVRAPGRLDELRESMRVHGWVPEFPAIQDELGATIVGHRRLLVAKELDIEPVIKRLVLGDGDAADAYRLRLALVSNIGWKEMTPKERQDIAGYLYGEREWSQQKIAEALNVGQKTISRDLEELVAVTNSGKPRRGRPRGSKTKHDSPKTDLALEVARKQLANGHKPTRGSICDEAGVGDTPAQDAITILSRERVMFGGDDPLRVATADWFKKALHAAPEPLTYENLRTIANAFDAWIMQHQMFSDKSQNWNSNTIMTGENMAVSGDKDSV